MTERACSANGRNQAAVLVANALFHLRRADKLAPDLSPVQRAYLASSLYELEHLAGIIPANEITYPETGTNREDKQ